MTFKAWQQGRRHRPGTVLILFALLLFAIMALAALVIDIGFARLTQRQMQTAVDASALEGLRFRDQYPPEGPLDPGDNIETTRRKLVRQRVAQWFDDDLNPDNGDAIGLGAGPIVNFTDHSNVELPNASQLMEIPLVPFYKPHGASAFSLNLDDAPDGDQVQGTYAHVPVVRYIESADYDRDDFDALDSTSASTSNSFLVRMRRTGENFDENVGTAGPRLPYLFARGAMVRNREALNGIAVRATAIADARPAMAVGSAISSGDVTLPGLVDGWAIEVQPNSEDPPTWQVAQLNGGVPPLQIGSMVAVAASTPDLTALPDQGYLPIVKAIEGSDRVIGFAVIEGGQALHPNAVPRFGVNASACPLAASAGLQGLDSGPVQTVLQCNRQLLAELSDPPNNSPILLLAPVSVR